MRNVSGHVVACRRFSAVALAATLLSPQGVAADDPVRPTTPDPLGPLVAATRSADPGELSRLARRVAPRLLAECVAKAARPRRLACLEASGFAEPDVTVVAALAEALFARDRAVAVAAGAGLERLLQPEALAPSEVGPSELAQPREALARAAADGRLAPDVRAAALHVLTRLPAGGIDAAAILSDPDPLIRREAVAALSRHPAHAQALAESAMKDSDEGVAAAAAAAVCEAGRMSRELDARVRGWLAGSTLGPASLAPLLACARARPDGAERAWLEVAARSPRPDVRALLLPVP
jgi:hypothetical protein